MSPSTRRRDKLFVIAELLGLARDGIRKTQMMQRANLSYTQFSEYLGFLLRIDLVKRVEQDGRETYVITPKGLDFLQRYEEIFSILQEGPQTLVCPYCQKEINANHRFCPFCGKALKTEIKVSAK